MNAICVENLTKRYGANEVLKGVNLKVDLARLFALASYGNYIPV